MIGPQAKNVLQTFIRLKKNTKTIDIATCQLKFIASWQLAGLGREWVQSTFTKFVSVLCQSTNTMLMMLWAEKEFIKYQGTKTPFPKVFYKCQPFTLLYIDWFCN